MLQFTPINASGHEEEVKASAHDEIASSLEIYLSALKLQQANNTSEALAIYKNILRSKLFKEHLDPVANLHDSQIHTLYFCVFKNYAILLEKEGELEIAVEYYLKAHAVDPADVATLRNVAGLWERLGQVEKAYLYLLKCFKNSTHPTARIEFGCILAKLTFDAGLFPDCLNICSLVLQIQPNHAYCTSLHNDIIKEHLESEGAETFGNFKMKTSNGLLSDGLLDSVERLITPTGIFIIIQAQSMQQEIYPIILNTDATLFNFSLELLKTFSILYGVDLVSMKLVDPDVAFLGISKIQIQVEYKNQLAEVVSPIAELVSGDVEMHNVDPSCPPQSTPNDVNEVSPETSLQQTLQKRKTEEELTRSSSRFRQKVDVDKSTISISAEYGEITDLNEYLPQWMQFDSSGPVDSSLRDEYWAGILVHLQSSSVRRPKIKRKKSKKISSLELNTKGDGAFYTNHLLLTSFIDRIIMEPFPSTSSLIMKFIIYVLDTVQNEEWTQAQRNLIFVMIQALGQFTCTLTHIFSSSAQFKSDEHHIGFLIFVAELAFDRLQVEDGAEIEDAELDGIHNKNPLIQCTAQSIFDRALAAILRCLALDQNIPETLMIRWRWIQAKRYAGQNIIAMEMFNQCKLLVDEHKGVIEIRHCATDAEISSNKIMSKIQIYESKFYIDEIESLASNGDHQLVLDRLIPLLMYHECVEYPGALELISQFTATRRLRLFELMVTAANNTKHVEASKMIALSLAETLICLNDVDDFDSALETICAYTLMLTDIFEGAIIDVSKHRNLAMTVADIIFMSWLICKNIGDLKKAMVKSTFLKRIKILTSFCARSWVMVYSFLRSLKKFDTSKMDDVKIGEVLIWAHNELGIAGLCSGDSCKLLLILASFLKLVVKHMMLLTEPHFQGEFFQCYKCMYATSVKITSDQQLQHHENTKVVQFGNDAALMVLQLIEPFLLDKIKSGTYRFVTNDLRQCLDMVTNLFKEPPMENPRVKSNAYVIMDFLDMDIDLSLLSPDKQQQLSAYDIPLSDTSISPVLFSIFFIEAKILLGHYMIRMEKTPQWLHQAAQKFLYHLYLRPMDTDAWISLGQCYSLLVTDILTIKSVKEYPFERQEIADLQKKAYHCFVRASKLLGDTSVEPVKNRLVILLWTSFTHLNFSIMSEPMNGDALKSDLNLYNAMRAVSQSTDHQKSVRPISNNDRVKQNLPQMFLYLRKIAVYCLKKSVRIDDNWESYYHLAQLYYKIGSTSNTVINTYLNAISKVPREWFGSKDNEKGIALIYKMTHFLAKASLAKRISHVDVIDAVEKLVSYYPSLYTALLSFAFKHAPRCTLELDHEKVIAKLCYVFQCLENLDKKNWHHKPIYAKSFIMGYTFGQWIEAQQNMEVLIQLKSPARCFKFWKTEFERPGGHFVYQHKYAAALAEFAFQNRDAAILSLLCQRIYKADESFFKKLAILSDVKKYLRDVLETRMTFTDSFYEFNQKIDLADLEALAATETTVMQNKYDEEDLIALIAACDVKRLRITEEFNQWIANMYCKLFLKSNKGPIKNESRVSNLKTKDAGKIVARALAMTKNGIPVASVMQLSGATMYPLNSNTSIVQPLGAAVHPPNSNTSIVQFLGAAVHPPNSNAVQSATPLEIVTSHAPTVEEDEPIAVHLIE